MKYLKKQDVEKYLKVAELAKKPLPAYVKSQMDLVEKYLSSDKYYSYSDSPVVFNRGQEAEKRFIEAVNKVLVTDVSDAEKEFLRRLVAAYGHYDAITLVPELQHPEMLKGGKTAQDKFFEKYGVMSMEDAVYFDNRIATANESVSGFMDSLELPGDNSFKYLIYRDESVKIDKELKEALAYHSPLAVNDVLHQQIERGIGKRLYELQLLSDWNNAIGPYCSMRLSTGVHFGRVEGYDKLCTITVEKDNKGFVGLIRKP